MRLALVALSLLAATVTTTATRTAHADPILEAAATAAPAAPSKPFDPGVTISVEPVFLIAGIVEANVEVKVAPHVGLQAVGGYGVLAFTSIKELGSELNVYSRPQLTGFHAGAMAKYMTGSPSFLLAAAETSTGMMESDGRETELGVYAGWKWVGWRHVTAVLQGGVGRLDLTGGPDRPTRQVVPIANFTAGYAF